MMNLLPVQKLGSGLVEQIVSSQKFETTEAQSVFKTLLALYGTENLSRALKLYLDSNNQISEAARAELVVRIERWRQYDAQEAA